MHRHAQAASAEADWAAVSAIDPCQICGGHEGCRRGFDGAFICCMRESSERPFVTGGWLHPGSSALVDDTSSVHGAPASGVRRTLRGAAASRVSVAS